jgi:hypothetical protein
MKITALATAGSTVYAQVFRDTDGYVWSVSGSAFEAYVTANIANYAILMTQLGSASGVYSATFPAGITLSDSSYSMVARIKAGGSYAESDAVCGVGNTTLLTSDSLATGAITDAKIADGAITSAKFTVAAITGVASGILEKQEQLWRRFFKSAYLDLTGNTLKTYADDGTTVLTTQVAVSTLTTQTQGPAT